jgi:tetraacyldisaccharide 4'-kinase
MSDGAPPAAGSTLERWVTARWYSPAPIGWLVPLVPLYIALAWLDRVWQRLRSVRLPLPVVVVGNLTVGGTGKTPLVIHLVELLRARGRRPGVVSRGYGGDGQLRVLTTASTAVEVGDEPLLIARCTGAPVAVGPDRVAAAHLLLTAHPEVDVLVSDDGLQHLRLARDLELCVIDGARGLGNGWRLPAGPLREAASRLAGVDLVLRNGGQAAPGELLMTLAPGDARRFGDGATRALTSFAGAEVHAVAGIGNPSRFFAMLEAAGLSVMPHPRPDHAPLALADLPPADGRPVLLTEKDAVKLGDAGGRDDLWVVPVAARFDAAAAERLGSRLDRALETNDRG